MNVTKIGENAGLVWAALENGALLYLALGWLAREGKLTFTAGEADVTVALA